MCSMSSMALCRKRESAWGGLGVGGESLAQTGGVAVLGAVSATQVPAHSCRSPASGSGIGRKPWEQGASIGRRTELWGTSGRQRALLLCTSSRQHALL